MRTAGEERRIRIICHLMQEGASCVSDIAKGTKASIATTSHHLLTMAKEGLVVSMRDGKRIRYVLPRTPLMKDLRRFICTHAKISIKK